MNETYLDLKHKILKKSTKEERDFIRLLDKFLASPMSENDLGWIDQIIQLCTEDI